MRGMIHAEFYSENLMARNNLVDLGTDRRTILK
jgi:hypothetical protein